MRKEERVERLLNTLDMMFPDAECELIHRNPFELLVAVVLSAQTTDASVNKITPALFERFPDAKSLASVEPKEIEPYIHSIGLYRNKAKSLSGLAKALVERYDGQIPSTKKELTALPGVGIKTANVVVSVAFKQPALAVDTHVERVSKRLKLAKNEDSVSKVEEKLCKAIAKDRWIKTHHQLIFFGRYFCKASRPSCEECPLFDMCVDTNKYKYRHD